MCRVTTAEENTYDVVVLGGGSTGENVADTAVKGGLSAVLVESELVGGDCSYWACIPSKALLRGPEVLSEARAVRGAKEAVTGQLDVQETLARRSSFTGDGDDSGQVKWVEGAGITLVRGIGRLDGEKTVVVTADHGTEIRLTARHAVAVCTGSEALIPPIDGLREINPWTAREATSAKEPPGRLVVVGGGVVGCEMATAWRALGSEVTVIELADHLLPNLEPEVGEAVAASLRDKGVDVRIGTKVTAARREGDEAVISTDEGEVRGDEVLVAIGRRPRTAEIGLDTVGLKPGRYLEVDESMQVPGTPWLYAMGDANGRRLLTHMGKYQARQGGAAIVARARGEEVSLADWSPYVSTADNVATPSVVFTDPQVASVGRTVAEAERAGLPFRRVEYELGNTAGGALFADGYKGKAIAVVDTEREVLLGVTLIGYGIGEMIHAGTVAVVGEVPLARLWHAVPSFPTMTEIWLRLLETYRG
jgi:pyruvate/2-oxoglutarate dehydrogenase complex dihydrolipoamide dehydrogenase (E3) component